MQLTCAIRYANVTLGLPCVSERAVYNGLSNELNNITIARDNCRTTWPFLYCDPTSLLCEKMKNLGLPCENDRECLSVSRPLLAPLLEFFMVWFDRQTAMMLASVLNLLENLPKLNHGDMLLLF